MLGKSHRIWHLPALALGALAAALARDGQLKKAADTETEALSLLEE